MDTHTLEKEVRLFFQKEKYISVKDGKVKEAIKAHGAFIMSRVANKRLQNG